MSVVVGCSYPSGVVLVSDARVTVDQLFVDRIQKLMPLSRDSAIGFVGGIDAAARLLAAARDELPARFRIAPPHGFDLLNWLPRFLRNRHAAYCRRMQYPFVQFMVASALPGRPAIVRTARVTELMKRSLPADGQSGWMSGYFGSLLGRGNGEHVAQPDFPLCLLYTMTSPNFEPQFVEPLTFGVIGMESDAARDELRRMLDDKAPHLFCQASGNPFTETQSLAGLVSRFVDRAAPRGVGGLFPSLRVDAGGVVLHGHSTRFLRGTWETIELVPQTTSSWTQRNVTTGKEEQLVAPWAEDWRRHRTSRTFDDLRDAHRASNSPRRFRAAASINGGPPVSLTEDALGGSFVLINSSTQARAERYLLATGPAVLAACS